MTPQTWCLSLGVSRKTAKTDRKFPWLKMIFIQTCALSEQLFVSNSVLFVTTKLPQINQLLSSLLDKSNVTSLVMSLKEPSRLPLKRWKGSMILTSCRGFLLIPFESLLQIFCTGLENLPFTSN